jgi:hypothetical protein
VIVRRALGHGGAMRHSSSGRAVDRSGSRSQLLTTPERHQRRLALRPSRLRRLNANSRRHRHEKKSGACQRRFPKVVVTITRPAIATAYAHASKGHHHSCGGVKPNVAWRRPTGVTAHRAMSLPAARRRSRGDFCPQPASPRSWHPACAAPPNGPPQAAGLAALERRRFGITVGWRVSDMLIGTVPKGEAGWSSRQKDERK